MIVVLCFHYRICCAAHRNFPLLAFDSAASVTCFPPLSPSPWMASSAAAGTIHKGVWEPLSHIVYGYAIYPLSPAQIRDNLPPVLPRTGADASPYQEDERERAAHEIVALELGDEIYAFERYTPKASETRDVWYRGCAL